MLFHYRYLSLALITVINGTVSSQALMNRRLEIVWKEMGNGACRPESSSYDAFMLSPLDLNQCKAAAEVLGIIATPTENGVVGITHYTPSNACVIHSNDSSFNSQNDVEYTLDSNLISYQSFQGLWNGEGSDGVGVVTRVASCEHISSPCTCYSANMFTSTSSPTQSPIFSATLDNYNVPKPNCAIAASASDTNGVGDVICEYGVITGPTSAAVKSEIFDSTCEVSITAASLTGGASTTGGSSHTAVINVTLPQNDGNIRFCIKTSIQIDNGTDVMDYQLQIVTVTYSYGADFTVSSTMNTEEYDGDLATTDGGTRTFEVQAVRCDVSGNEVTGAALALGDDLNICITSQTTGVYVESVTNILAKKATVNSFNVLNGVTDVLGEGTQTAFVATRLPIQFFTNGDALSLDGEVQLSGGVRRLLTRILVEENGEFHLEIDVVESSSSGRASASDMSVAAGVVGMTAFVSSFF